MASGIRVLASTIALEQFCKIGMIIGRVITVKQNEKAKIPAYLFELSFGPKLRQEHLLKHKKEWYVSSAQLCANHQVDELADRQVLSIYNFPRKQIGNLMSDCLVTGVQKDLLNPEDKRKTTIFMEPSSQVEEGAAVAVDGTSFVHEANPRNLDFQEFLKADLRIGTVLEYQIDRQSPKPTEEKVSSLSEKIYRVAFRVHFGEKQVKNGFGLVRDVEMLRSLKGQQAMFLTNLDAKDLEEMDCPEGTSLLCTVGGKVFVRPAKQVEDGYKLA